MTKEGKSRGDRGGLSIVALVTDAHGGIGGISQYNRHALQAICSYSTVGAVHVFPRFASLSLGELPEKLHYHLGGLGGVLFYAMNVLRWAFKLQDADIIYCAHINLAPLAIFVARLLKARLVLVIYGVEAWKAVRRTPEPILKKSLSAVISISELTRDRFLEWCRVPVERTFVVPNAIRTEDYGAGAKNSGLLRHYGLMNKTVLMTMGRIDRRERRLKGFDRVIRTLPKLAEDFVYLVVGDGDDRPWLEAVAEEHGVRDRVIFTGRVDDRVKPDLYRLADVYVMPSLAEGFGFVIIEALASGVPVVASAKDGTREAVRGGDLGVLVDPEDPADIRRGIVEALGRPRGVPAGLTYFSYGAFAERLHSALATVGQL